jgi:hypothetical protein
VTKHARQRTGVNANHDTRGENIPLRRLLGALAIPARPTRVEFVHQNPAPSAAAFDPHEYAVDHGGKLPRSLAKTLSRAYSRIMALMDKIKKWLGMGKKKA